MFYNEFDLLELRLKELGSVVDIFVILEGEYTFSGLSKDCLLLGPYINSLPLCVRSKIRYIPLREEDYPSYVFNSNWDLEHFTRNQLKRGLYDAKPLDFVWISDLDEIPQPDCVFKFGRLSMLLCYYKLNLIRPTLWVSAIGIPAFLAFFYSIQHIRDSLWFSSAAIPDGGWHFSYVMTADKILEKIGTHPVHQVHDARYHTLENIQACIETGRDIWHGESAEKRKELDFLPRSVLSDLNKYGKFITVLVCSLFLWG